MESLIYENNKVLCGECKQQVGTDNQCKLHFCPKCGNPLNLKALEQYEQKTAKDKIVLLYELLDEIEEGNDAKQTILNFIEELK